MPGGGLFSNPRSLRAALLRGRCRPAIPAPGSIPGRRGEGYEFVELRAYAPGDDPRRIDWAASARSGTLQTRVLQEENALEIAALVDASGSMSVGRRRPLAAAAAEARDAWFAIAEPGDRVVRVPGGDVVRALAFARARLRPGAALLLVSDFFGDALETEAFAGAARALARRVDVTALVARDPWADGLPLGGFVRLRDAETGAVRRFYVGRRERAAYRAAVAARETALAARLRRFGWRTGTLHERDGRASVYATFGLGAA